MEQNIIVTQFQKRLAEKPHDERHKQLLEQYRQDVGSYDESTKTLAIELANRLNSVEIDKMRNLATRGTRYGVDAKHGDGVITTHLFMLGILKYAESLKHLDLNITGEQVTNEQIYTNSGKALKNILLDDTPGKAR